MVTFRPAGRLGNWLFQFTAAWCHAKMYGFEFCQPYSDYDYILPDISKVSLDIFHRPVQFYKEIHHGHNILPVPIYSDVVLEGYFQSYKYFNGFDDEILNLWNPDWIKIKSSCSIHVRRGDYLLYPTKHPVITEFYLDQAIAYMKDAGAELFIFFSDDVEWTRSYAKKTGVKFIISEHKTPWQDLQLMSCCEHNIISNSSFSWWGAYLNWNTQKLVITPHEDNWFGIDNKHLNVSDLLPPFWQRIKF
jgi:hypothetical protein